MNEHMIFPADRISGAEACNFAMSAVLAVFETYQKDAKYTYPFYGAGVDTASDRMTEWIRRDEYVQVADRILADISASGIEYFENLRSAIVPIASRYVIDAKMCADKIPALSDEDLINAYKEWMTIYRTYYAKGLVTFLYEEDLSERLYASLSARYKNATEYIQQLVTTSYTSFILESEQALQKVRNATDTEQKVHIEAYLRDFYFMRSTYLQSEVLTPESVVAMANKLDDDEAKEIHKDMEISLTDQERAIVALLKEGEIIRDQRKKIATIGNYVLFSFLHEVARRRNVDMRLAKRIFWYELPDLMDKSADLLQELKTRTFASLALEGEKFFYLDYDAFVDREKSQKEATQISGTPASKGKAQGPARIIFGASDFDTFKRGDVLVAEMTRPEFLPVMRLASAIVTDEGGLMCHAAVVAREMGKPCIVGTRSGTKMCKNGDMIEVNADKGIVRKVEG